MFKNKRGLRFENKQKQAKTHSTFYKKDILLWLYFNFVDVERALVSRICAVGIISYDIRQAIDLILFENTRGLSLHYCIKDVLYK